MRETLQPAPTALALPALNMSYGAANQLLSVNGEATTFDADGNMTFGPLQEQMTEFSYDSRNRLSRQVAHSLHTQADPPQCVDSQHHSDNAYSQPVTS
ncbi:MAG: hypothetical protein SVR94_16625, partial [Pseudomonadota bacterium]|nr:hypothetical protein [Pseudomonadota bacterium]